MTCNKWKVLNMEMKKKNNSVKTVCLNNYCVLFHVVLSGIDLVRKK